MPAVPAQRHGWKIVLRAFAMAAGSGVLWWETRAPWAVGLLGIFTLLLVLAAAAPRAYAPVARSLDGLQDGVLRLFTWLVLGLVFVFIFIPAGVLMRMLGRSRVLRHRKEDTYWREGRPADPATSFGQQF
jgi:hypothetical protein